MRRRRRAVTRSYQTELTAHQFLDGVAEFWTYTHAHRAPGLGAPTRYLPPGFVEPLFEEAPADAGPVNALVFPHTGQTRNACKRPAGGRWPVRHAFDAGHPDDWRKWATRPDTVFINQHKYCADPRKALEAFRMSTLLSFGALVISDRSDARDEKAYEGMVIFEDDFYGNWSAGTVELMENATARVAFKRRALELYRERFAPGVLHDAVDVWNERDWAGPLLGFRPAATRVDGAGNGTNATRGPSRDRCAATDFPRSIRCCPNGTRYKIALFHSEWQNGGMPLLRHMYAPARDTLANGLRSRAAECGYDVTEYVDTDAPDRPLNLQRGDVAIWIGAMHRKKFVVPKWVLKKGHAAISTATRLRNRGVYVIEYQTEPHSHEFNPGVAEVWTYTRAHRVPGLGAPTRYVPPGYLKPVFKWQAQHETRPVDALFFVGHHGPRRFCGDPAGGRFRVKDGSLAKSPPAWLRHTAPNRAYLNHHKGCSGRWKPLEAFRLSQMLSIGALVVSDRADAADELEYEGLVLFQSDFYKPWPSETLQFLANATAREAFKRRAHKNFAEKFEPAALLRAADAWNENNWAGRLLNFRPRFEEALDDDLSDAAVVKLGVPKSQPRPWRPMPRLSLNPNSSNYRGAPRNLTGGTGLPRRANRSPRNFAAENRLKRAAERKARGDVGPGAAIRAANREARKAERAEKRLAGPATSPDPATTWRRAEALAADRGRGGRLPLVRLNRGAAGTNTHGARGA